MLRRKLTLLAERLGDVRLLALVGADDIPVERVCFDGSLDSDELAAELGVIGRDIVSSYQELAVGRPRLFSIAVGQWIIMSSFLSSEYSLLLVADARIGRGRARFELRRARLLFEGELR